jgi:hypothetical protein
MEETNLDLAFEEEETELDALDQAALAKVSSLARESYLEMQAGNLKELDFQEKLHLEMQVQQAQEIIFQCNLDIADFIASAQPTQSEEGEPEEKAEAEEEAESPKKALLVHRISSDPVVMRKEMVSSL